MSIERPIPAPATWHLADWQKLTAPQLFALERIDPVEPVPEGYLVRRVGIAPMAISALIGRGLAGRRWLTGPGGAHIPCIVLTDAGAASARAYQRDLRAGLVELVNWAMEDDRKSGNRFSGSASDRKGNP